MFNVQWPRGKRFVDSINMKYVIDCVLVAVKQNLWTTTLYPGDDEETWVATQMVHVVLLIC